MRGWVVTKTLRDGTKAYHARWRGPDGRQHSRRYDRRKDADAFLVDKISTGHEGGHREVPLLWRPREIPGPTASFHARDIARPLVYAWRRGTAVLYVGQSAVGLRRPFGRHHVLAPEPEDVIDVWLCESAQQAVALESRLLAMWRPVRNRRGLLDSAVALRNGSTRLDAGPEPEGLMPERGED